MTNEAKAMHSIPPQPSMQVAREEKSCTVGCKVHLDAHAAKDFKKKIDDEYRVNMILDNLPVAVLRQRRDGIPSTTYEHGFGVGLKGNYAGSKEEKCFIHNHLSFQVMYHQDAVVPLCLEFFKLDLRGIIHKELIFLIKECCSSRDDILRLISGGDEMRGNLGFRLNYPCRSMLWICLAKLDLGLIAFAVCKGMSEDGFLVGEIDYRMIINALCKNGLVQAADMFISRVLQLRFALDVLICTSPLLVYCRIREVDEAFKVLALMSEEKGFGVNSVTLIERMLRTVKENKKENKKCLPLLSAQSSRFVFLVSSNVDKAREFLVRGVESEEVDIKWSLEAVGALIKSLCDEGLKKEALIIQSELEKRGISSNAVIYNRIMGAYGKSNHIEGFEGLFAEKKTKGVKPTTATYNILMDAYSRRMQPEIVEKLLQEMEAVGLKPNMKSHTCLISAYKRQKKMSDMAADAFLKMKRVGIKPSSHSYTALIHAYSVSGIRVLGTRLSKGGSIVMTRIHA